MTPDNPLYSPAAGGGCWRLPRGLDWLPGPRAAAPRQPRVRPRHRPRPPQPRPARAGHRGTPALQVGAHTRAVNGTLRCIKVPGRAFSRHQDRHLNAV